MAEYIEREKLAEALKIWQNTLIEIYGENDEYVRCLESVLLGVDNIPAADVRPVVRGKWIDRDDKYYGWNMWACSACGERETRWTQIVCNKCGGKRFIARGDFVVCDKCGARMGES